jgi:UDP-N-acetylmuramate dehydrogenase
MMTERQKKALMKIGTERLRFDCPMRSYTSFKIGGAAEVLYQAEDLDDLCQVLTYLGKEDLPFFILGRGSNLLVRDNGIEGVVIILGKGFTVIEMGTRKKTNVEAGGGASLSELLAFCRTEGLSGLEFLSGIPGSVGGAVAMNAGAFGYDIASRTKKILIVKGKGKLETVDRSQLEFRYRHLTIPKGSIIVKATFEMKNETPELISERMTGYLKQRKRFQPLDYPSAGSIFKNPPNDYAGRLIEKVGLKGTRIGDAVISDKHANWIVNTGQARAEDVLSLIDLAKESVEKATGIRLQEEIKVVGVE